jgi:hypothetical protein
MHTLTVETLGEGDKNHRAEYRLNLVVENSGFLPVYTSAQGKKQKAIRPVRVLLDLPEGVLLVNGKRQVELGYLEGRSNKLDVDTTWAASPTDNRARAEWILRGPAGVAVRVNVLSERAGSFHKDVWLV